MNREAEYIISELRKAITSSKNSSSDFYFLFLHLDITNLLYSSITSKKLDLDRMLDVISIVLKRYQEDLGIIELMKLEHNFAFIVSGSYSGSRLHEEITEIYREINKELEFFIIAKFYSVNLKLYEAKDAEEVFLEVIGSHNAHYHNNYLYHTNIGEFNGAIEKHDESIEALKTLDSRLEYQSLFFMFQPIFSCSSGDIEFYECLLRFKENGEIISAAKLIIAAEEYDYIGIIDEYVLDLAFQTLKENSNVALSINFSKSCIDNDYLISKINKYFSDKKDLASRLIIEFTETLMNFNLQKAKSFILHMQSLGIRIALDDFGKGYTSFHQIKSLNVDIIKIDGAFIKDAMENIDNQVFIEAIVKIAQETGALTVAEFVENGYTAKYLIGIGIDYMQGNYLSAPIKKLKG